MSRWSLRRRVGTAFAVAGFLSIVAFLFTSAAFANVLDGRERLLDRLVPAVVSGRDLSTALVNQETGVRGFVLAGEDSFLEPYRRGWDEEQKAGDRLDRLIGKDRRLTAALEAARSRAREWREQSAEPIIAAVRGAPGTVNALLPDSLARFDAFRAASTDLEQRLADELDQAEERLDFSTKRLAGAAAVAGLVIVMAAFGIWQALRRWVLVPLNDLGSQTRAVTAGELRRPIVPSGPPELRDVSADTEAMRHRLLEELVKAEEAQAELAAQAEELARSNADLEQFAYVASHDLQEPLRKVTSFCQLLERRYAGQLDERADQYIAFAVEGAKRMQLLINDLLSFSRVGRTTDRFTPVDLDTILATALRNLEAAVEDTDATIVAAPLPTVNGDRSLLTTLFQNLVGNAIKFRADAPPRVEVSATALDGEEEWEFVVRDNGIGIDPAYVERVFVIFQRLHSKEQYPGTGIGLALCKKIVEFHGGRIWVDTDEEGPGTTIRFVLPVQPVLPSPEPEGAADAEPESEGALR